jgi:hypothetical protein
MEHLDDLVGRPCKLPNGEKGVIESVQGSEAVVRRTNGPREGTRAVCSIAKLRGLRLYF